MVLDTTLESIRNFIFELNLTLDTSDKFQYNLFKKSIEHLVRDRKRLFNKYYNYDPELEKNKTTSEKYESICRTRYPRAIMGGLDVTNDNLNILKRHYRYCKEKSKILVKNNLLKNYNVKNTMFAIDDIYISNKNLFYDKSCYLDGPYIDILDSYYNSTEASTFTYDLSTSIFADQYIDKFADFNDDDIFDKIKTFKNNFIDRNIDDIKITKTISTDIPYLTLFRYLNIYFSTIFNLLTDVYTIGDKENKKLFIDRLLIIDENLFNGMLLEYIKNCYIIYKLVQEYKRNNTLLDITNMFSEYEKEKQKNNEFVNEIINSTNLSERQKNIFKDLDKELNKKIDKEEEINIYKIKIMNSVFKMLHNDNSLMEFIFMFSDDKYKSYVKNNLKLLTDFLDNPDSIKIGELKNIFITLYIINIELYRNLFLILFLKEMKTLNKISDKNIKDVILSKVLNSESFNNTLNAKMFLKFSSIFEINIKLEKFKYCDIVNYTDILVRFLDIKFKGDDKYYKYISIVDSGDLYSKMFWYDLYQHNDKNEISINYDDIYDNIELKFGDYTKLNIYNTDYKIIIPLLKTGIHHFNNDGIVLYTTKDAEKLMATKTNTFRRPFDGNIALTENLKEFMDIFKNYVIDKEYGDNNPPVFINERYNELFKIKNHNDIINMKYVFKDLKQNSSLKKLYRECVLIHNLSTSDIKKSRDSIYMELNRTVSDLMERSEKDKNYTKSIKIYIKDIDKIIFNDFEYLVYDHTLNISSNNNNMNVFYKDYGDLGEFTQFICLLIPTVNKEITDFYLGRCLNDIKNLEILSVVNSVMSTLSIWLLTNHGLLLKDINEDNYNELMDEIIDKLECSNCIPNYSSYQSLCSCINDNPSINNIDFIKEILDFYKKNNIINEYTSKFILDIISNIIEIGYFS